MELKTQKEIAKLSRHSPVSVNYICKGVRPCGRRMAEDLEEATGIGREAWVWPSRWFNPYIEGSSSRLPKAETLAGKIFEAVKTIPKKEKPKEEPDEPRLFGIFEGD